MEERSGMVRKLQSFPFDADRAVIALQAAILIARQKQEAQDSRQKQKRETLGDGPPVADPPRELVVKADHINLVLAQRQGFLKYRYELYEMSDEEKAFLQMNRKDKPGISTP